METLTHIDDEAELVLMLRSGDQSAFSRLYQLYSKIIYRKIARMTQDEDQSKELVQDVFMKVWEKKEEIEPGRSFKSFLFTVAINKVYDHFRKVARDKSLEQHLIALYLQHQDEESDCLPPEKLKLLTTVIDILPPQRKQIFMLCKIEGRSYAEIAKALNISSATVRDHMVKANKAIRKFVDEHHDTAMLSIVTTVFYLLK